MSQASLIRALMRRHFIGPLTLVERRTLLDGGGWVELTAVEKDGRSPHKSRSSAVLVDFILSLALAEAERQEAQDALAACDTAQGDAA
ncbi:hypothetical protein [Ancylobacter radicis]|uniref:Uncharacterized protein n=1 Tax=Ancylobacter radicis TaxID=2836179 RepID=A0ABS5R3H1_9HYPH|nr:hypothetical protein [Ancylobacter radicis]MBS9476208.1 hypothetical protein [Ancylobacter radicis]